MPCSFSWALPSPTSESSTSLILNSITNAWFSSGVSISSTPLVVPTTTSEVLSFTSETLSSTTLFSTSTVVVDVPTSTSRVTPSPSTSAVPLKALNNDFWSNKGIVGGTFTAVGLCILGIIVFFVVFYTKRRKTRRAEKRDEERISSFYDNELEPEDARNTCTPGVYSLTLPALDPFAASGDVIHITSTPSSSTSPTPGGTSTSVLNIGTRGDTEDGHTTSTSHGHTSSKSSHHGFSSISYHTGLPESPHNGTLNRPQTPLFFHPKISPAKSNPVIRPPRALKPKQTVFVPLGTSNTSKTPFPPLNGRQTLNDVGRRSHSGADYYANHHHSLFVEPVSGGTPAARSIHPAISSTSSFKRYDPNTI